MTYEDSFPKLDKPGAGLGFFKTLFLRFVLMPKMTRNFTFEKIEKVFDSELQKILQLIARTPAGLENKPVLVKPIPGLEDSSRFWSVNMTLEHMVIVGQGIQKVVEHLAKEQSPDLNIQTATVKPIGLKTYQQSKQEFIDFFTSFFKHLKNQGLMKESKAKIKHPWFGPITLRQWLIVAAVHPGIHRRQLEQIVAGF